MEISILALCTAKLGRLQNDSRLDDKRLLQASSKLYAQALLELRKTLWDKKSIFREETLAACLALAIYEVIACPAENSLGYISHYAGAQMLLRLRGPISNDSDLGYETFIALRLQGVSIHFNVSLPNSLSRLY
jgi:hypothetical protein